MLSRIGMTVVGAGGVLLVAVAARAQTAVSGPARQRPNVVLIVADDLGFNSVGYHGEWIRTPHIDSLASGGAALERFYVSPMCSPTRMGLMTGRYPMRYGMARSVVRPWMRYGLPTEERTIADALGGAGYRNRGAFGKWHLGHLEPKWHPLARGFTRFEGLYNGAADYWTRDRDGEMDWHVGSVPTEKKGYTTDLIADAAAAFIREVAASGPFFCYVPFTAPHDPHQAPDAYLKRYAALDDDSKYGKPSDLQAMAAMTTCMDDGIGRILKALDETGTARNTLVWFLSDNGGLKKLRGVNRPFRDGKLTVYEGGVRVPAAVRWPGVIEGGRRIAEPIMNLDVLPTLLRAAGVENPGGKPLDGIDVLDLLAGRSRSLPSRELYCFTGQSGLEEEQIAVIAPDGWKLVVVGPDIRRQSQPSRFATSAHRVELFQLNDDPREEKDLAAANPDRVKELGAKLLAFRESEPALAMAPVNKKPADFKPPGKWRSSYKP